MQHSRWPAAITTGGKPLLLAHVVEAPLDDVAFLPVVVRADGVFVKVVARIPAPDAPRRMLFQDRLVAGRRVVREYVSPIVGESAVGVGAGGDAGRKHALAVGDGGEFDFGFGE